MFAEQDKRFWPVYIDQQHDALMVGVQLNHYHCTYH